MNMQSAMCKVGPTGGETFTVTCFACGMPSSKEWAQRVRSQPHGGHQEPFYPFLMDKSNIPPGAIVMEDGSTYLCAFCHALLEAQWNSYEMKEDLTSPRDRSYNVHKFICAVCGVETYRKRVRALPFQEFPFLIKARQPGSITLGNNPLAVVCLDCSETLWAQSAEYDRWGLPIHKRHFNWMARPPPPEDSVEATVARLPSGETQLPRCPPTDPLVPPKTNEPTALPEPIPPVKRPKMSSARFDTSTHSSSTSRHHHHHYHQQQLQNQHHHKADMAISVPHPGRKISTGSQGGSSGAVDASSVPVVTVAPMGHGSTQHTLTNSRKDSMSYPPSSSSSHHKYDNVTITEANRAPPTAHGGGSSGSLGHHQQQSTLLFHQTPLFSPSGSYPPGPFPWPLGMDAHTAADISRHPSPYAHFSSGLAETHSNPPTWPWLPPTSSSEFLRYQSYIASLQSRGLSDPYYQVASSMYPPTSASSSASYLPHLQFPSSSSRGSSTSPQQQHVVHSLTPEAHSSRSAHHSSVNRENSTSPAHSRSGSATPPQHYHHHHKQHKVTSGSGGDGPKSPPTKASTSSQKQSKSLPPSSNDNSEKVKSSPKCERSPEHRLHWKQKKSLISSSTKKVFLKPESSKERGKKTEVLLPKKRHWLPPTTTSSESLPSISLTTTEDPIPPTLNKIERKRTCSTSSVISGNEPMDFTVRRKYSLSIPKSSSVLATTNPASNKECAIDLSVPAPAINAEPEPTDKLGSRPASCPSSSKFSIAFLCKSETTTPSSDPTTTTNEPENQETSTDSRSSVIVSIPIKEEENEKPEVEAEGTVSKSPNDVKDSRDEAESEKNEKKESDDTKDHTPPSPKEKTTSPSAMDVDSEVKSENTKTEATEEETVKSQSTTEDNQNQSNSTTTENVEDEKESPKRADDKSDDGEITHVHLVTVEDFKLRPEDFVMKTIENFVNGDKEMKKMKQERLNEQLGFLSHLGLITPKKKLELELDSLVSRSMKNTVTPLKLRVPSPVEPKLDEELEHQLLEVAFDDPSLRQNSNDPVKSSFLQNLGLKVCTKAEKSRREVEWRLILTERIMREKRDERLRGVKRPWDSYNKVSKMLSLPKRISKGDGTKPENLTFLTLTLPPEGEEGIGNGTRRNSSDLLTTVEANSNHRPVATAKIESLSVSIPDVNSSVVKNGNCINYPVYIPSYVLTAQSKEQERNQSVNESRESQKLVEILNVPSVNLTGGSLNSNLANEPILKIPVINTSAAASLSARRRSSTSTLRTTDDSEEELSAAEEIHDVLEKKPLVVNDVSQAGKERVLDWSEVEVILKASTAQWEKTKKVMEEALQQTDYMGSKENKKVLDEQAAGLKTIRKHLKVQQADMRQTEKLFKGKEKQIMKKLRNLTKYSKSKEDASTTCTPQKSKY